MLTADQFIERWGDDDPLTRFAKSTLDKLKVGPEDREFLSKAGLPSSAAPMLDFKFPKSGALPTLAKLYSLKRGFDHLACIGTDGAGNPIAIDESDSGKVVRLDHEDSFRKAAMNTSVRHLAACLLACRDLTRQTNEQEGDAPWLDGNVPDHLYAKYERDLISIDPESMKQVDGFWQQDLQTIRANMKWYRDNQVKP